MSGGKACIRGNRPRSKDWRVCIRKANYSAFSGDWWTPSDYSEVTTCLKCGMIWRTKAAYVDELKDMSEAEWRLWRDELHIL